MSRYFDGQGPPEFAPGRALRELPIVDAKPPDTGPPVDPGFGKPEKPGNGPPSAIQRMMTYPKLPKMQKVHPPGEIVGKALHERRTLYVHTDEKNVARDPHIKFKK